MRWIREIRVWLEMAASVVVVFILAMAFVLILIVASMIVPFLIALVVGAWLVCFGPGMVKRWFKTRNGWQFERR